MNQWLCFRQSSQVNHTVGFFTKTVMVSVWNQSFLGGGARGRGEHTDLIFPSVFLLMLVFLLWHKTRSHLLAVLINPLPREASALLSANSCQFSLWQSCHVCGGKMYLESLCQQAISPALPWPITKATAGDSQTFDKFTCVIDSLIVGNVSYGNDETSLALGEYTKRYVPSWFLTCTK